MRIINRYFIATCCLTLLSINTWAADLMQVYHDALQNDPKLKQARAQRDEDAESMPQAFANLLPQLSATGNLSFDKQDIKGERVDTNPPHNLLPIDHKQGSRGMGFEVSLEQSIFNFNNWIKVASAHHKVKAAFATYTEAAQDLIKRTAKAYFNVLKARDNVRFTQAEKKALKEQYKQAQANYKVGTKTITDVYNAKAAYDTAKAEYVQAKNSLSDQREDLRVITGHYYDHLKTVNELPLVKPHPHHIKQWVKMARSHNWQLKAAKFKMLAAHDDIGASEANHIPTVGFEGSFSNNYSNNVYSDGSKRTKETSASIEMNVPIFSGGATTSQVRQAIANYNDQASQFTQTHREVVRNTRSSYLGVMSGISKIKADRQAIKSHKSSLKGMREGYKVGTRTIVDVLAAEKDLYKVQRQAAEARYEYLTDLIELKKASGTLDLTDLKAINGMLDEQQSNIKPSATDFVKTQS